MTLDEHLILPMTSAGSTSATASDDGGRIVLEITDLRVEIASDTGMQAVVNGISLICRAGKTLAVVGESGAGKTMAFLTVMDLLPARAVVTGGEVRVHGRDVLPMPANERRRLRGTTVAMVFQDALTGLSPSFTIGQQIIDVVRNHTNMSRRNARKRAIEILDLVRIPHAARRLDQYPHQLSGGMRQRVMIGMAVAMRPDVLIADEPTTALDVTVQEQVLDLLQQLRDELAMSLVLITHDLGVVARYADDVAVMYSGRFVEKGTVAEVFGSARHPYTVALRSAIPRPDIDTDQLSFIPGHPPRLHALLRGCSFAPRCFLTGGRSRCVTERPELIGTDHADHLAACHFSDELVGPTSLELAPPPRPTRPDAVPSRTSGDAVLRIESVSKTFRVAGFLGSRPLEVRAVDDVSLSLYAGETLGLVGESGCGKTTLGRMILGLTEPTSGRIVVEGSTSGRPGRDRTTQIVFQDPYASLDPRQRISQIIAEPLRAAGVPRGRREARVSELLARMGFGEDQGDRYPHQFSGGQRQRIGIARSVALTPRILVLDEPVSALDVSIQAQILNMLQELRDELGLTYLLISHDLSVIRQVSDRVAVMYLGHLVELAGKVELYERPHHPYTEALLSAAPIPDPTADRTRTRIHLHGDLAVSANPVGGCPLHPRCHRARHVASTGIETQKIQLVGPGDEIPQICVAVRPAMQDVGDGHLVACHFPTTSDATMKTATALPRPVRRS